MKNLSNKIKIFLVAATFLLFAGGMFLYGYGILGARNQAIADSVTQRRLELDILQREQKNFEQGKKDLAQLESATYPPEQLFSNDTKVVKEIQQMEAAANLYNLQMELSISGTTKTAEKVPGAAEDLYVIPYTLTLNGTFNDTLLFTQATEHLPFVTQVKQVAVSVAKDDQATTIFTSEFYIKK